MGIRIDVLTSDGSPLGVTMATLTGDDPHQPGIGGAELALLTLCELWAKRGDDVTLYNTPRGFDKSPFHQSNIQDFNGSQDRDVLIIFRSPNYQVVGAKGKKIWWSCDQYTIGSFRDFAPKVDKIVTISQFHADYFKKEYGIENTITIDLPVRTWEYENKGVMKIPKRCLFSSIPDRGLRELLRVWPQIVNTIPEASLVITSDYRLWGIGAPMNNQYCSMIPGLKNVTMRGAVRRSELVEEQLKAEVLSYPCNYDELFCYSVAEAECAGILPVTTRIGALDTTNFGWFSGRDEFADTVIKALNTPKESVSVSGDVFTKLSLIRFGPERILAEWDKVFAS
jgi:glycosyltransferase involved in cell wall biosynthesis